MTTFEKWYNSEYDAWLEGKSGYALEEELQQAFEAGQRNCNCVNTDNTKVIAELTAQIEKMKCCGNCKFCDSDNPCEWHRKNTQCPNYSHWSLTELNGR